MEETTEQCEKQIRRVILDIFQWTYNYAEH